MSDRYYASVFGGQVCRDCGSVVLGLEEHDDYHLGLDWLAGIFAQIEHRLPDLTD